MKLSSSYEFNAPPEKVWQVLTDPESLCSCIPGCERLEATGENEYEAAVTVALGPMRTRFNTKVSMLDQKPHQSYRLVISGNGSSGFVNGEAIITLEENGGKTTVSVEGESQSGGLLARVGQRMMDSVARNMMDRFFSCLQQSMA